MIINRLPAYFFVYNNQNIFNMLNCNRKYLYVVKQHA